MKIANEAFRGVMMKRFPVWLPVCLQLILFGNVLAAEQAVYNTGREVPVTAQDYVAAGKTIEFTLSYAPRAGTILKVVEVTGPDWISGEFSNLAQGQHVTLTNGGLPFEFIANYHGGTGNDLELVWATSRPVAWGWGYNGQLGSGDIGVSVLPPTNVVITAALAGRTIMSLTSGNNHSYALLSDGSIAAWGENYRGELGVGSRYLVYPYAATTAITLPVAGTALEGRTPVMVSSSHTLTTVLCSDHRVVVWGVNTSDVTLGTGVPGDAFAPVLVPTSGTALEDRSVTAISSGLAHTLALCSDGTIVAWGVNTEGELGDGTLINRGTPIVVPTAGTPLEGRTVSAVAAGGMVSFALCTDGTLVAWGYDNTGDLGIGSVPRHTIVSRPTEVARSGASALAGKFVKAVASGTGVTAALCSDGTVVAWGALPGDGSNADRYTPVAVDVSPASALAGRTVERLAVGRRSFLAMCSDGSLVGWGEGANGVFTGLTNALIPKLVVPGTLSPGEHLLHAYSGCSSASVLALVGTPQAPDIAVEQPAGVGLQDGSATVDFSTAVMGGGTARTFTIRNTGNASLNLSAISFSGPAAADYAAGGVAVPATLLPGASASLTITFSPRDTGPRAAFARIASNDPDEGAFEIAMTGDGLAPKITVEDFAGNPLPHNAAFELGRVTRDFGFDTRLFTIRNAGSAPLTIGSIDLAYVTPGYDQYLVFPDTNGEGTILAPGGSMSFKLYFSLTTLGPFQARLLVASSDPKQPLTEIVINAEGVFRQSEISIEEGGAVLTEGAYTWGSDSANTPVPEAARSGVIAAANGVFGFTVALKGDGSLMAWGNNAYHQLQIPPGYDFKKIAVGSGHAAALRRDNTVVCWGDNMRGQCNVPAGLTDVQDIVASEMNTYALKRDGTIVAWGDNQYGQLNVPADATNIVKIAAGPHRAAAFNRVHKLFMWGENKYGENTLPADWTNDYYDVALGYYHTIAMRWDGVVVTWGRPYGVGSKPMPSFLGAAADTTGMEIVSLAAGYDHSMALFRNGTAVTWGQGMAEFTWPAPGVFVPASFTGLGSISIGDYGAAAVKRSTVDFGSLPIGVTAPLRTITIRNLGTETLHLGAPYLDVTFGAQRGGGFFLKTNGMAFAIPPGGSTSLSVTMAPEYAGLAGVSLVVPSDDADEGVTRIFLTGTGTGAAEPAVLVYPGSELRGQLALANAASITLPTVTLGAGSSSATFTVLNGGLRNLNLAGIRLVNATEPGVFSLDADLLSGSIETFESFNITVTLDPDTLMTQSVILEIPSNDPLIPVFSIQIAGHVISPVYAAWRAANFGSSSDTAANAELADIDGDGIPNFVEFALALDPHSPAPPSTPAAYDPVAQTMTYSYTRSKAAVAAGFGFRVQWSVAADGPWASTILSESVVDRGSNEQVTATIAAPAAQLFTRLTVSEP